MSNPLDHELVGLQRKLREIDQHLTVTRVDGVIVIASRDGIDSMRALARALGV